jgi:hypothetical protein
VTRALVHPAFDARYYGRYVAGLGRVLGPSRVRFSARGFPVFGSDCLAVRLMASDGRSERKVYLHSNDHPELDEVGLEWCDAFGKVNLDPSLVPPPARRKVFALGPTFAIRVWGPGAAEARGFANFLLSGRSRPPLRRHMASYRGQYASRFPESDYRPHESDGGYVFFNAALWEREPEANALRARFIDACRAVPGLRFEGGLSPRKSARGDPGFGGAGFEAHLCPRFGVREYLEKTRISAVVLNNPAYRDCHSWRLAEYLAMGKAIVTTPIVRALPAPLAHGTHVHVVNGSADSLRDAVERIHRDAAYRRRLETNARRYYERHLAPEKVARRVLSRARVRSLRPSRLQPL